MEYFTRLADDEFAPTDAASGAWTPLEQHIAPMLGLMTHIAETDRDARRGADLQIGRLSFDILGTLKMEPFTAATRVLRPGRSIELVEVTVQQNDRAACVLRAWLMQPSDTTQIAATPIARIPDRSQMQPFDGSTVWPGGFVASTKAYRDQVEPGHAALWISTDHAVVGGEAASPFAYAMSFMDVVNGLTVRADPSEVHFPNIDLTAHFFRRPEGAWIGYDTRVSFGPGGIGETNSTIHDAQGPIGTCAQILTVRPR